MFSEKKYEYNNGRIEKHKYIEEIFEFHKYLFE